MPICGFVRNFEIEPHPKYAGCLRVTIRKSGNSPDIFPELIRKAFPRVDVFSENSKKGRFLIHGYLEHIVVKEDNPKFVKSLKKLLNILRRCITIEDDLDESHALSPHYPKNEDDKFYRSEVGTLVNHAKDYTGRQPFQDRRATQRLIKMVMNFVDKHPRYRRADAIAYAPSSNPSRNQTLPSTVASVISKQL